MKKPFWSGISVFVAGNFVSVSINELKRQDYTIVNQDAFLNKFFIITRMPMLSGSGVVYNSPLAMPEVEERPQWKGKKLEFKIEQVGSKQYKIIEFREVIVTERRVPLGQI